LNILLAIKCDETYTLFEPANQRVRPDHSTKNAATMSTARQLQPISVAEYLSGEQNAVHKHEYVEGIIYAMVGATNAHNRIATNGTVALGRQLRGKSCQVFNSDTKIRVRQTRGTRFYYPDLSVVCRVNPAGDTFQDEPVLIIEVISESTRRTDEYEKRESYLSINSLRAYIRIEQSSAAAVVDRRIDSGFEREVYIGQDAVIPLPEIQCDLPLAELYENVEFLPLEADNQSEQPNH
jgi:Uma2 family endonuclease